VALAALACGAAAVVARSVAPAAPLFDSLEWLLEAAGCGLEQVEVTGHRFTSGARIFEAIALGEARTLLSFDSRAAQARIEQLPFIASAEIERVFPGRLVVRIRERSPMAVWQVDGRHWLIDASGRTLSAITPAAAPELPRLKGDGAAREGRALLEVLAIYPKLLKELTFAERVEGRRWALHLASGDRIQLPATGVAAALAVAAPMTGAGSPRELDLRVPGRLLVRPAPASAQRAATQEGEGVHAARLRALGHRAPASAHAGAI
jgi:cell division protein FtsQ